MENQITFTDDIQIENLTEDNGMFLNEYSQEQISNLMMAVINRIGEVNQDQMGELGLEESQNPLFMMTPLGMLGVLIYQQAQNTVENSNLENQEIQAFNNMMLNYEGQNTGIMAKVLLEYIANIDPSIATIQITGVISDVSQIDEIKDESQYEISFSYNSEGRINQVLIEEITQ